MENIKRDYWPTKTWKTETNLGLDLDKLEELNKIIPSK